eukprot:scaffold23125_cov91-Cyclotella_meneghiniana.AAC.8
MATINRKYDPILPVLDCNPATQESRKKRQNCYEQFDKTKKYRHIIERKQMKHGRRGNNDRVKFALFLKYLIHHLQVTDQQKYKKAKQIVLDCTQLQREGKLEGTPLTSALKGRLYGLVGQEEYSHCEKNLSELMKNHGCTGMNCNRTNY